MPVARFPDPRTDHPDGLVAVGGDLHPDSLVLAYRQGIFPWPHVGYPLLWFSPPQRGVLELDRLHLGRSVRRLRRITPIVCTLDRDFAGVIRGCAAMPRPGQQGTWITREMIDAYERLHHLGIAHSVEAWLGERLVGGVYGVAIDGTFSAESMFRTVSGASKLALLHLLDHVRGRGLDWIDVQVMTPHVAQLGGREIDRDDFLDRLMTTRQRGLTLFE